MANTDVCLFREGFVKLSLHLLLEQHRYSCRRVRPSEPLTVHSWTEVLLADYRMNPSKA